MTFLPRTMTFSKIFKKTTTRKFSFYILLDGEGGNSTIGEGGGVHFNHEKRKIFNQKKKRGFCLGPGRGFAFAVKRLLPRRCALFAASATSRWRQNPLLAPSKSHIFFKLKFRHLKNFRGKYAPHHHHTTTHTLRPNFLCFVGG